jgi:hypothetical protein
MGLFVSITCSGLDEVIDHAVTVRESILRSEPTRASSAVVTLSADTQVEIFERRSLWVRLRIAGQTEQLSGWLRFTELRFRNSRAASSPSNGRSIGSGFAGFSRSVTEGSPLNNRSPSSPLAERSSATIGIRGLTVAEIETAQPDANALATISQYAMSAADAEMFASAGGLSARHVPYAGQRQ